MWICFFSFPLGIYFIIYEYSHGIATLNKVIFIVVVGVVLGTLAGVLSWATVYEPRRREIEKLLKKRRLESEDTSKAPNCIKNNFRKNRISTPQRSMIYFTIVFLRSLLLSSIILIPIVIATGLFTWERIVVTMAAIIVFSLIVALFAWMIFYKPAQKKIEKEKQSEQI